MINLGRGKVQKLASKALALVLCASMLVGYTLPLKAVAEGMKPEAAPEIEVVEQSEKTDEETTTETVPENETTTPEVKPEGDEIVPEVKPEGDEIVPEVKPEGDEIVPEVKPEGDEVVPEVKPEGDEVVPEVKPEGEGSAPVVPEADETVPVGPDGEPLVPQAAPQIAPQAATDAVAMIGDVPYATFDDALKASKDGETITLLKDAVTELGIGLSGRALTIDGNNHKLSFNTYGIYLAKGGDKISSLTFNDCTVAISASKGTPTVSGEGYPWATAVINYDCLLNFNNCSVSITQPESGNGGTGIYYHVGSKVNLDNTVMSITGMRSNGFSADVADNGKPYTSELNVMNNSKLSVTGCYAGVTAAMQITVDHSEFVNSNRGNGSNGADYYLYDSVVSVSDNGSHGMSARNITIKNSTVDCNHNGYYGITAYGKVFIDGKSVVNANENARKGGGGVRFAKSGTVADIENGAKVTIDRNKRNGLENYGKATFEEGAVLEVMGNHEQNNGGGIYNGDTGVLVVPSNARIYNNHAQKSGDDIMSRGSITFGAVGDDWYLDGTPNYTTKGGPTNIGCEHKIDNWYMDEENARWNVHFKPVRTDAFTGFGAAVTGNLAIKAAHNVGNNPEVPTPDPIDPPETPDWEHSKSKHATNLDKNLESKVTLSLPSAEKELVSDVVFVLDKSTSATLEDQALAMLRDLKGQIEDTNAKVNVGVVIFNKEAHVTGFKNLATEYSEIEAAIKQDISSGTNTHAGMLAGKAMLDADTSVDASHKHLIFVSDGITYMFNAQPTHVSWSFNADGWKNWAGPDNYASKYGSNDAPANWAKHLGAISAQMKVQGDEYDYLKGTTPAKSTPQDETSKTYVNSVDKAHYLTYETYKACANEGYHCYAMVANQGKGQQYEWGPSFMQYLANGKEVTFEDIKKEIVYLLDAGSTVEDVIGYGKDNKGNEYNMDFIPDASKLSLTVGGVEYTVKELPVDATEASEDALFVFNAPAQAMSTHPNDAFVLHYYKANETRDEHFVWDINVPVSNFAPVQLTYTVKLMNAQDAEGSYGAYDAYGKDQRDSLYTNNSAVLFPVDSHENRGEPEVFDKPTVSYGVREEFGTTGLILIKKDKETGAKIPGVEFTLYADAECTQVLQTATTDRNGQFALNALEMGKTYYMKETAHPQNYEPLDAVFTITVPQEAEKTEVVYQEENGQVVKVIKHQAKRPVITCSDPSALEGLFVYNDHVEVRHEYDSTDIVFIKKDKDTKAPIAGVEFTLYADEACTEAIQTATSAANGQFVMSGLEMNKTYYMKETAHPQNYEPLDAVFTIVIAENESRMETKYVVDEETGKTVEVFVHHANTPVITCSDPAALAGVIIYNTHVEVRHEYDLTDIQFIKKDKETKAPIAGVEFTLYADEACTQVLQTVTSSENGQLVLSKLEMNKTYYMKETAHPQNYEPLDAVFTIVITENESRMETKYVVDEETGKTVEVFVHHANTPVMTCSDPAALSGVIIYNDHVEVRHEYDLTDVTFVKRDKATNENLEGVEFTLYADEACTEAIQTATSNEDGQFVMKDLEMGKTYYMKETAHPQNYEPLDAVFTITVEEDELRKEVKYVVDEETGKTVEVFVHHAKLPTITSTAPDYLQGIYIYNDHVEVRHEYDLTDITFVKEDKETKAPIAGVEFTVYADEACTEKVQTATTDKDGKFTITGLSMDKIYYMKETAHPQNYEPLDAVFTIYIVEDKESMEVKYVVDEETGKTVEVFVHHAKTPDVVSSDPSAMDGLTIYNTYVQTREEYETADVTFIKVDSGKKHRPLKGAEFTLYGDPECTDPINNIKPAISGRDGHFTFENLEAGTYYMKETEAPRGYKKLKDVITIEIKEGRTEVKYVEENGKIVEVTVHHVKKPVITSNGSSLVISEEGNLILNKRIHVTPEEPDDPDDDDDKPHNKPEPPKKEVPQTDDNSNIGMYAALLGAGVLAIAALIFTRKKKHSSK